MNKDQIRILITRFFEHSVSKELFAKFQQWFLREDDRLDKDEVLSELWEKQTASADSLTLQGLDEMKRRIGNLNKSGKTFRLRRLGRIAAILLLPVISALLTFYFVRSNEASSHRAAEMVEYTVPDGEMEQIVLPDGSTVWLNAGSMLLYSESPSASARRVFLTGEATFHVTKDPARPFTVKTQYLQVEALGTTFNVKSYTDAEAAAVTLEEGLVRIQIEGKVTADEVIYPDEQYIYDHRHGKVLKTQVDARMVNKWKEGYMVFENASFEEIIRTVERRFNVTIQYDIRKYGGGSFSVKYRPYEDVEQVLTILETLNPGLKWTKKDANIEIR
ncbi:MAG TPA: FecR family protein [Porphyromonadaceae bacterium]|jgi:ferric-dicitrate binding protein FerR (iron transport regulator)|uniref:FecR family protein n=1 Tax=Limibacterium fermenti TaxID=3229863 RepID=UPI000E951DAC|nr:FecR family protein [Porphyromonadaceae bacterium]HBK30810.1 FecR family protein [Porphyromonadaceae bacterium]HBL34768.1 FecR family protein [Porphyromonadaceae bacterium]HBX21411.1 FecR family protein [Porphyromonadaceae bacterium]HBX46642.1 FecR family protein [Porphyromonadaceae bacterium]